MREYVQNTMEGVLRSNTLIPFEMVTLSYAPQQETRGVILPFEREAAIYDGLEVPHPLLLNCAFNPLQKEVVNDLTQPGTSWFFRAKSGERLVSPATGVVVDARRSSNTSCEGYLAAHETNLMVLLYQTPDGPRFLRMEHMAPSVRVGDSVRQGDSIGEVSAACGEEHMHLYSRDHRGWPAPLTFANRPPKSNDVYHTVDDAIRKRVKGQTIHQRRAQLPQDNKGFDRWRNVMLAALQL